MIPLYPKSWQRAALLVTIASIVAVGLCAWGYTVDDAFIVARYATRLAEGDGYTFNPGPPTDGVTGPLWLAPGWLARLAGLDPVWAAKCAGLACAALASAAWTRRLSQRSGGTRYACAAAALFAFQPTLGGWGAAGLETGAATLALTVAVLALTARPIARPYTLGVAVAVLPWLRPELAVAAGVLAAGAFMRLRRGAVPVVALAGLGLGALVTFRWTMFGSVVPLAFYAKQGSLEHGLDYAARGAAIAFGVFGLPLLWLGLMRGRSDDRWAFAVIAAHFVAVVLAGGDWMPGFRLFAPVLPLAIGLIAVGTARAVPSRPMRFAACGLAAATAAVFALDLATRMPEWSAVQASREGAGRALAERLKASVKRAALVDIGFLGYASGVEIVDLGGITDPEIARMPGGHLDKAVSDAWLAARAPDALVLHSARPPLVAADGKLLALAGYPVERRVAAGAWVKREFRVSFSVRYAPHYHYVLLQRDPAFRSAGD